MPKLVKHGKQSLVLSKDFALDTEGSKYSDSSSIPKDGFSRLLDLIQVSHNVDENSTYYDHSQSLKRLHVVIFCSMTNAHTVYGALHGLQVTHYSMNLVLDAASREGAS
ncbi:hypothetical protein Syun_003230 [Stephania yunnanensis]|uniref:Uncharacterized protein n=1 Tax=Stephania yunnanensis TaxID=152371 RepID=A0AAP0L0T8_9MAGN